MNKDVAKLNEHAEQLENQTCSCLCQNITNFDINNSVAECSCPFAYIIKKNEFPNSNTINK